MDMNKNHTKRDSWEYFLLRAAREISLSESQYEKIGDRYSQLQNILSASDDPLLSGAHIFVQGSMRLKTTIKPILGAPKDLDTIDADAIVWLPNAKNASASEVLEAIELRFQDGSRVHEEINQLRRGVRIVYADQNPSFHIDVTPARAINGNDREHGEGKLEVPDRETGWKASSPILYSNWLDAASKKQISLEQYELLAKREGAFDAATQAPLPDYNAYVQQDPLRATIKLLKRHRDEWAIRTKNKQNRPISAIITTLATHAYLEVANESMLKPLRPLDAIIAIVERMQKYVNHARGYYEICNPADNSENFAEKWNRPNEGRFYRNAFLDWHESAIQSVSIGLGSYVSAESFAKAIEENFGMNPAFIASVNTDIPANWTLPGRAEGTTRNTATLGALFGISSITSKSQASVKPVERLG